MIQIFQGINLTNNKHACSTKIININLNYGCINLIFFCRKFISKVNFNKREDLVLHHFERVSNAAFSGLVDEAAYFRGMGRKYNLNMNDLRNEVLQDLRSSSASSANNDNSVTSGSRNSARTCVNIPSSNSGNNTSAEPAFRPGNVDGDDVERNDENKNEPEGRKTSGSKTFKLKVIHFHIHPSIY